MTDLEKLIEAKKLVEQWRRTPSRGSLPEWLDSEIDRLRDPHAIAKEEIRHIEKVSGDTWMVPIKNARKILCYVRYLEGGCGEDPS